MTLRTLTACKLFYATKNILDNHPDAFSRFIRSDIVLKKRFLDLISDFYVLETTEKILRMTHKLQPSEQGLFATANIEANGKNQEHNRETYDHPFQEYEVEEDHSFHLFKGRKRRTESRAKAEQKRKAKRRRDLERKDKAVQNARHEARLELKAIARERDRAKCTAKAEAIREGVAVAAERALPLKLTGRKWTKRL